MRRPSSTVVSRCRLWLLVLAALAIAAHPARAAAPAPVLGNPVQYVIVTTSALAPSFAPLVDWKIRKGVPAAIKMLESIQAEYPVAADDAERVRLFLKDAYAAGARYALIGGDTDVIPIRYATTTFYTGDLLPTDLYYACLDGNWNADGDGRWGEGSTGGPDGDSADLVPELAVGRAPVRTPAEVLRVVQRTIQYERFPAGDYEDSRLYAAVVLFPANWTPGDLPTLDGADLVEPLMPMHASHAQPVTRLYQNFTAWPGALPETRASVLNALNQGTGFATLIGRGNTRLLSAGDADLTTLDALALTNATRPFPAWLLSSQACQPDSESIGEALLRAPVGGAVACIGSGHYSFPTAERFYHEGFQHLVQDSSELRIGRAFNRARLPLVPFSTFDSVHRWTQMTLTLLGDPDLAIWTRRPRALAVSHPATLAPGQELIVDVTGTSGPLAGAKVTLYQPGAVLAVLTTDVNGRARVTPVGAVDGPMALTVTADDYHADESTIVYGATTPAAAAFVSSAITTGRVTLTWYAVDWSPAATTLERSDSYGGLWSTQGRVESDGRGLFTSVDENVVRGTRYEYRIALRLAGSSSYSQEVSIDVPGEGPAGLAFETVAPHPVTPGARVTFTLAGRGAARLEVFDLAGRVRWSRGLDGAGAGRHVIALEGADRLRPGLYLLRLTEGGVSRSRRIVVR